jgi:hypothetical protein
MFHGGTFVVEAGPEYATPIVCPRCNPTKDGSIRIHYYKAHHITLDENGNGIISEGVYNAILEADPHGLAGLEVVNEVKDPPPLTIGMGALGQPEVISGEFIGRNGHG